MKLPLSSLFFLFCISSFGQSKSETLYELRPDEKVLLQDEHYLALFGDKLDYYLFTQRGTSNQITFIFNGKEIISFDTLFRCMPPDVVFYKKGKRYRFDPVRAQLLGPFDRFDDMGVDVVVKGKHMALVAVRGETPVTIIDGKEITPNLANGNDGLLDQLLFSPAGGWTYLKRLDSITAWVNDKGETKEVKKNLVLPEYCTGCMIVDKQLDPSRLVYATKSAEGTSYFLNDTFLFQERSTEATARTNASNTIIEYNHPAFESSKFTDHYFIWANGKKLGPFEPSPWHDFNYESKLGNAQGSFAKLVNPNAELLLNGEATGIKNVARLAFNPVTGSTFSITEGMEVFFNRKSIGKFPMPVAYSYYLTTTAGVEKKDSTRSIISYGRFLYDTDNYYFSITKNGEVYYHLSNGTDVPEKFAPVFARDLSYGYIQDGKVIIKGKPMGDGFSLSYDPRLNAFKWLSLNGRKIMLNSYQL